MSVRPLVCCFSSKAVREPYYEQGLTRHARYKKDLLEKHSLVGLNVHSDLLRLTRDGRNVKRKLPMFYQLHNLFDYRNDRE